MVKITGEVYETMFQGLIKTQNYIDCLKMYLEETLDGVDRKGEKLRKASLDSGGVGLGRVGGEGEGLADSTRDVFKGAGEAEGSWLLKL